MNVVVLTGNLTKDIELKYSQSGTALATGTIAVQRRFKNQNNEYESDFIRIKAFGKTAELLANHFRKGSKLCLQGNIQTGSYENNQGQKIYTTDVIVENITFVERKQSDTGVSNQNEGNYARNNQNGSQGYSQGNNAPFGNSDYPPITDNDLPF